MNVALLRAVNVGGNNPVPMAELRAAFAALGFSDARTLLQSGNVVFDGGKSTPAALEKKIEAAIAQRFGLCGECMVRDGAEWAAIVARNPLPKEARVDPAKLHVVFLKETARVGAERALKAAIAGPELVRVRGREAYVFYPDGAGRTKLTPGLLARGLGRPGTARNWNTVLKLAALLEA